jgi:hypothetical protein
MKEIITIEALRTFQLFSFLASQPPGLPAFQPPSLKFSQNREDVCSLKYTNPY